MISITPVWKSISMARPLLKCQGIRQITGTGGQWDFVYGSFIHTGGKSYLCMASTFKDKGATASPR